MEIDFSPLFVFEVLTSTVVAIVEWDFGIVIVVAVVEAAIISTPLPVAVIISRFCVGVVLGSTVTVLDVEDIDAVTVVAAIVSFTEILSPLPTSATVAPLLLVAVVGTSTVAAIVETNMMLVTATEFVTMSLPSAEVLESAVMSLPLPVVMI